MIELVIVENVNDNLHDREVVEHFHNSISLKSSTYKRVYGDNVIAVSSIDYISTHIILYDKEVSELPICSYQVISNYILERFGLDHPVASLIRKGKGSELALKSFESFSDSCNGKMLYMTSTSRNKLFKETSKIPDLVLGTFVRYFREKRMVGAVTATGLKIRSSQKATEVMGFKDLCWDNKAHDGNTGQNVLLLSLKEFPKEASSCVEDISEVWKNRKVYESILI